MGGASTEIGGDAPTSCSRPRTSTRLDRPHRAPAPAAQRGVASGSSAASTRRSPASPCSAASDLLVEHGGAQPAAGYTVVGSRPPAPTIAMPAASRPGSPGCRSRREVVSRRLDAGRLRRDGDDELLGVAARPGGPT